MRIGQEQILNLHVHFDDGTGGTHRIGHLWEMNFDAIAGACRKRLGLSPDGGR